MKGGKAVLLLGFKGVTNKGAHKWSALLAWGVGQFMCLHSSKAGKDQVIGVFGVCRYRIHDADLISPKCSADHGVERVS